MAMAWSARRGQARWGQTFSESLRAVLGLFIKRNLKSLQS